MPDSPPDVLEIFREEVAALVERFANSLKDDEADMVGVRDWALVVGAATFKAGQSRPDFSSGYLASDSPTYALAGLLRTTADEIEYTEQEDDL